MSFFYLFLSLSHNSYGYSNCNCYIYTYPSFQEMRVFKLLQFYYPNNANCFEFSVLTLFSAVIFCNSCWNIMVTGWRPREILFNFPVSLCYGAKVGVNQNSSGSGKPAQGNEVDPSASTRQNDKGGRDAKGSSLWEAEIHNVLPQALGMVPFPLIQSFYGERCLFLFPLPFFPPLSSLHFQYHLTHYWLQTSQYMYFLK